MGYRAKRFADAAAAIRQFKAEGERDGWSAEELHAHQQARIDAIVGHAAQHSPYYRERLGSEAMAGPVELSTLPTITKTELMENYDAIVTEPRLRRDELLEHAARTDGDSLHLGRYRVMTTSGSSGLKGVFVWDRPDWVTLLAGFMRFTNYAGSSPRLPRRRRIAYLGPSGGMHMSRRMTASMSVGIHRITVIPVTLPVAEIVSRLNRVQPDTLSGFPSVVALVAQEQIAGRLRIRPSVITTSSELLTGEMRALISEAFGHQPFDAYAATETGFIGAECSEHRGLHVFADHVALEVLDDRVLVTSLVNRVQPTIRLAMNDMVSLAAEPCPCGRPFPLLRSIEGRADDVLDLPVAGGRTVAVHPLHFAPVARDPEVSEFQVVQEGPRLRLRVSLRNSAVPEVIERRLVDALTSDLRDLGVPEPQIRVEFCERIERDPAQMGKLKLIVADRR